MGWSHYHTQKRYDDVCICHLENALSTFVLIKKIEYRVSLVGHWYIGDLFCQRHLSTVFVSWSRFDFFFPWARVSFFFCSLFFRLSNSFNFFGSTTRWSRKLSVANHFENDDRRRIKNPCKIVHTQTRRFKCIEERSLYTSTITINWNHASTRIPSTFRVTCSSYRAKRTRSGARL